MYTIKEHISGELTEKKSKFISDIFYIETVKEAEQKIQEIRKKYHDAKHHCFAYRVIENENIIERASDDGEPAGTAGAPMLQLLSKNNLVNILVVVTRYFGGILLGTGGLVRAYSSSTTEGLNKAKIVTLEQGEVLKISVSYQNLSYLQYYCKKNGIIILQTNFESNPYIVVELTKQEKDKMLQEISKKQFCIEKMNFIEKTYLKKDT